MSLLTCAECGTDIETMGTSESHIPSKHEHPLFTVHRTRSTGGTTSDYCCSRECLERYIDAEKHLESGTSGSYEIDSL